jgi:hypothetical protein
MFEVAGMRLALLAYLPLGLNTLHMRHVLVA